jgi:hypothetical protein
MAAWVSNRDEPATQREIDEILEVLQRNGTLASVELALAPAGQPFEFFLCRVVATDGSGPGFGWAFALYGQIDTPAEISDHPVPTARQAYEDAMAAIRKRLAGEAQQP